MSKCFQSTANRHCIRIPTRVLFYVTVWQHSLGVTGAVEGSVHSVYVYSNDSFDPVVHCVVLRINVSVV